MKRWETSKVIVMAVDEGSKSNDNSSSSPHPTMILTRTRLNIFLNTVYFVLGFSLIFAVLGVILNSVLSVYGAGFQHYLTSVGGIVIIGFGAYLILSTRIRGLNFEKKMTLGRLPRFKTSYITSFVFGASICSWLDSMRWTNLG